MVVYGISLFPELAGQIIHTENSPIAFDSSIPCGTGIKNRTWRATFRPASFLNFHENGGGELRIIREIRVCYFF